MKKIWTNLIKPGKKKQSTEFKSFFKVSLHDRPISILSKSYEIYKVNPIVGRMIFVFKWCFALSFILYFK